MLNNKPTTIGFVNRNFSELRSPLRDLIEIDPGAHTVTNLNQTPAVVIPENERRVQIVTHSSVNGIPYGESQLFTV